MPNQASDLQFYDIIAPQKVPLSKISDNVIACDLWFAPPPPQSNILATPMPCTVASCACLFLKYFELAFIYDRVVSHSDFVLKDKLVTE